MKNWSAKLVHFSGFLNYLDYAIQDILLTANLIIVQRNVINQGALDAIRYVRGMNIPTAIDLDDQYWGLHRDNPAFAFWRDNSGKLDPPPLEMLDRGLGECDGFIAPNRLLLAEKRHLTNTYYLQNYAEDDWWTRDVDTAEMRRQRSIAEDRDIIVWGGSVSHLASWFGSGIFKAAERVTARHPNLLWMICGNDPRIHKYLPVPARQKYLQPGVDPSTWPDIVKVGDIGIGPLYDDYDQHRSWIKGIESSLAGLPWIATAGEPYSDIAHYGTLIQNSPEAWEDALESLITNLPRAKADARDRIPQARQDFLIGNNLHVYEKVYGEIINNANLDRGRLPGVMHVKAG